MTRQVEIIVIVISTQWRAFSTQFCLTLLQESLTHSRGGGLFEGWFHFTHICTHHVRRLALLDRQIDELQAEVVLFNNFQMIKHLVQQLLAPGVALKFDRLFFE